MTRGEPQHLTDADLPRLGRAGAVDAVRRYLLSVAAGTADAPPRVQAEAGGRRHVLTIGADRAADVAGFRYYSVGDAAPPDGKASQALVLVRASTGEILATATGDAFGAWRTAALGAVAMVACTAHLERSLQVGVFGAGFQAYHHTRTWAAARPVGAFRIFARRRDRVMRFAADLQRDTGVPSEAVELPADACRGADAVLCVTRSPAPVFAPEDLAAGVYVATVGPKFGGTHEVPAAVYADAGFLLTDAPAQILAFEKARGPLPAARGAGEFTALADLVAGAATPPTGGIRLFVSEGLAGSEVALLAALLAAV